tara:strand:- start:1308 stop:1955 length:648 start_codon:yes stop_codon:yes gene_type:complete
MPVYKDNHCNRLLKRVGKSYGASGKKKVYKSKDTISKADDDAADKHLNSRTKKKVVRKSKKVYKSSDTISKADDAAADKYLNSKTKKKPKSHSAADARGKAPMPKAKAKAKVQGPRNLKKGFGIKRTVRAKAKGKGKNPYESGNLMTQRHGGDGVITHFQIHPKAALKYGQPKNLMVSYDHEQQSELSGGFDVRDKHGSGLAPTASHVDPLAKYN